MEAAGIAAAERTVARAPRRPWSRRATLLGLGATLAIGAAALTWAKWAPYLSRTRALVSSGHYPSSPARYAGSGFGIASPAAAWQFTVAYVEAIWPALVAALLIAAALSAFLPRALVAGADRPRRGLRHIAAAAALSLPTMMCTCCSAPVAVAMRRRGADRGQVAAFWLGNPMLNPAVLVFLAVLLPWRLVALRVAAGLVLVLGLAWMAGRLRDGTAAPAASTDAGAPAGVGDATRRFTASALRLGAMLVPEYVAVVFLVGLVAGDLPAAAHGAGAPLMLALLAVGATLFVIPTGGEIPLVMGALAAGLGDGVATVLLVALPAISIPSMVMVRRALGGRTVAALAAGVAAVSLLTALIAAAIA